MASKLIFFLIFSIIHVSNSASAWKYKSYKDYKLFDIEGSSYNIQQFVKYMTAVDNELNYDGNRTSIHMLVAPNLLQEFEKLSFHNNLKTKLIFDDYSQIIHLEKIRPLRSGGFSWTAYYDVDDVSFRKVREKAETCESTHDIEQLSLWDQLGIREKKISCFIHFDTIYEYLRNVSRTFEGSADVIIGGNSYEGRPILGLRINTKVLRMNKPVMFIESGIHAREWITPATTTYFINELLTNKDPEIVAMRDQFDWHIFPTVNPDGYHYSMKFDRMWRKTRSKSMNGCYGADPNRNWDYNWLKHGASNNPCDYQTFGGANAFSEIETRSLSNYIAGLENLQGYIAFHSNAQMLLLPYSDSEEHCDNYDDLVQIGRKSLDYGYKVNGEKYEGPATAAEILYKASGGSMDWVRDNLGTPLVYTYELRGRYFHWPPSRIQEQGDEVTQMMLGLVTEARNLGYF